MVYFIYNQSTMSYTKIQDHHQFIEAFASNLQLLLHNKFRDEGLELAILTPIYARYFNEIVTASKINSTLQENDWVGAFTGNHRLKIYFRLNKLKTMLLLRKAIVRSELEMLGIAKVANYNNLNSSNCEKLLNLVIFNYENMSTNEKVEFRRNIMQRLDISDSSIEFSPMFQVPATTSNTVVPPFSDPVTPLPPLLDTTNHPNQINVDILSEIIGLNEFQYNKIIPDHLPEPSVPPSDCKDNQRKRVMRNLSDEFSESIKDVPPKKCKPVNHDSPEQCALNQSSNVESISIQEPNSSVPIDETNVRMYNEHDDNVSPMLPIIPASMWQENGITLYPKYISVYNDLEHTENETSIPIDNHSTFSSASDPKALRTVCEVANTICDNMAFPQEISEDKDRLNPIEWVICTVSQDGQGYYKGREKLNCLAKCLDYESKSWKLDSNQSRKLKLPNKMVVFGEFTVENDETIFEIIDCIKYDDDTDKLLHKTFTQRFNKAQQIINQTASHTVEGVRVRMKSYVTVADFLKSGPTAPCNICGAAFLIHSHSLPFATSRSIHFDEKRSLFSVVQKVFNSSLALNNINGTAEDEITTNNLYEVAFPIPISEITDDAVNGAGTEDVENISVPTSSQLADTNDSLLSPTNKICGNDIRPTAAYIAHLLDNIKVPQIPTEDAATQAKEHTCTHKCVLEFDDNCRYTKITTNPFSLCKVYGWHRNVTERTVQYISPCNRVFDTYKKVMDFLLRTDFSLTSHPNISIDYFSFEYDIRENVEFPVWDAHVVNQDISKSMERQAITCVNEIDDAGLPEFSYITKATRGDNINLPLFDIGNCCICTDECQNSSCACVKETTVRHSKGTVASTYETYKEKFSKGYDFRRLFRCVPRGIYECNYKCKCNGNEGVYCGNRVIQSPLKWKLQVYRKVTGWGLRTLHDIPRGHFVCQFMGRMVLEEEANKGDCNYRIKLGPMFDCPYKGCRNQSGDETNKSNSQPSHGTPVRFTRARHCCFNALNEQNLYLDATHQGNVGRFINHAKKSNVFMQTVFIDEEVSTRPHVAFFAKENILAGGELTADFSSVRSGVEGSTNEKEITQISTLRPGPKQAKQKGHRNGQVKGSDRSANHSEKDINGHKISSSNNLPEIEVIDVSDDNDDVSSQGSSRSITSQISSGVSMPVLTLKKINIDQELKRHKLTRSQNNSLSPKPENLNPVKMEPVEASDLSCVKQEVVKMEVGEIEMENNEDENLFLDLDTDRDRRAEMERMANVTVDVNLGPVDNLELFLGSEKEDVATTRDSERVENSSSLILNVIGTPLRPVTSLLNSMTNIESPNLSTSVIPAKSPNVYSNENRNCSTSKLYPVSIQIETIPKLSSISSQIQSSQEMSNDPLALNSEEQSPVLHKHPETPNDSSPAAEQRLVSTAEEPKGLSPHFVNTSLQEGRTSTSKDILATAPQGSRCSLPSISQATQASTSQELLSQESQASSSQGLLASMSQRSCVSTTSFVSNHTIEDCMTMCCIFNESGFPKWAIENKLLRCLVFGFERKIERGKVYYETSCGKTFRSEGMIHEFLMESKHPGLCVDNFCFDAQIECTLHVMTRRFLDLDPTSIIISEDISKKKEIVPIRCISSELELDLENFEYIANYKFSEQFIRESMFFPESSVCDCSNDCIDTNKCTCLLRTSLRNEGTQSKSLRDKVQAGHVYRYRKLFKPEYHGIFECGVMCKCSKSCLNRVAQNQITWSLEVFNTALTGWGVKTLQGIPKGSFVCNYVGIFRPETDWYKGNRQYQVKLLLPRPNPRASNYTTPKDASRNKLTDFIIDATEDGNVARFINHSCSPNLFVQTVFVQQPKMKVVPMISLFANQDIASNAELTFDYSDTIEDLDNRSMACLCGASNCKERFL